VVEIVDANNNAQERIGQGNISNFETPRIAATVHDFPLRTELSLADERLADGKT
jgi:hypothetical protein